MQCANGDKREQSDSNFATPLITTKTKYTATSNQVCKRQKITHANAFATKVVMDNINIVTIANRREKIAIIAEAHKAKNYVKQQQMMFELFKKDPNSEDYKTFLTLMRRRYLAQLAQNTERIDAIPLDIVAAFGRPLLPTVITLDATNEPTMANKHDMMSVRSGPRGVTTQRLLSALQENKAICDVEMDGHLSEMSPTNM